VVSKIQNIAHTIMMNGVISILDFLQWPPFSLVWPLSQVFLLCGAELQLGVGEMSDSVVVIRWVSSSDVEYTVCTLWLIRPIATHFWAYSSKSWSFYFSTFTGDVWLFTGSSCLGSRRL